MQTWYAQLVYDVFLPNAVLFSYLVAYGELLVGPLIMAVLWNCPSRKKDPNLWVDPVIY